MDDNKIYTDPFAADAFAADHVCSACWGLIIKIRPNRDVREWITQCETCGEKTRGYVTRKWAQQRAEISYQEARAAKEALRDAVPWMKSNKPLAQLLIELGIQP